jgi:hypothetical protein
VSTIYSNLLDLISIGTHINHYIQIHESDSNSTALTNWFDLTGIPCLDFEPEPLNTFECVEDILVAAFE